MYLNHHSTQAVMSDVAFTRAVTTALLSAAAWSQVPFSERARRSLLRCGIVFRPFSSSPRCPFSLPLLSCTPPCPKCYPLRLHSSILYLPTPHFHSPSFSPFPVLSYVLSPKRTCRYFSRPASPSRADLWDYVTTRRSSNDPHGRWQHG